MEEATPRCVRFAVSLTSGGVGSAALKVYEQLAGSRGVIKWATYGSHPPGWVRAAVDVNPHHSVRHTQTRQ